jgi:peptide deformylase
MSNSISEKILNDMKIVHYPGSVLLQVARPIEVFDDRLASFVENMFETMYEAGGVGLAAPQVGVSSRIFVMDCLQNGTEERKFALINPEIVMTEGEQFGGEGCLSFPGIYNDVKRELRTVVRFQDVRGNLNELDVTELEARCVLHENDHLDGIVFLSRMSALKREMAKRKIKKLIKTGKWD